jgi:hypothetical protein
MIIQNVFEEVGVFHHIWCLKKLPVAELFYSRALIHSTLVSDKSRYVSSDSGTELDGERFLGQRGIV